MSEDPRANYSALSNNRRYCCQETHSRNACRFHLLNLIKYSKTRNQREGRRKGCFTRLSGPIASDGWPGSDCWFCFQGMLHRKKMGFVWHLLPQRQSLIPPLIERVCQNTTSSPVLRTEKTLKIKKGNTSMKPQGDDLGSYKWYIPNLCELLSMEPEQRKTWVPGLTQVH